MDVRHRDVLCQFVIVLLLGQVSLMLGCDVRVSPSTEEARKSRVESETLADVDSISVGHVLDLNGQLADPLGGSIEKGLVLIFTRTDCPIGNRYAPTIGSLKDSYLQKGIRFALVYPDGDESAENIRKHRAEYDLEIEAFRDPRRSLVSNVGVTVTPEAVVFDRNRRMVYRGRIDDRVASLGKERPVPTTADLQIVLEAMVSGETLEFSTTEAIGCFIE